MRIENNTLIMESHKKQWYPFDEIELVGEVYNEKDTRRVPYDAFTFKIKMTDEIKKKTQSTTDDENVGILNPFHNGHTDTPYPESQVRECWNAIKAYKDKSISDNAIIDEAFKSVSTYPNEMAADYVVK